MADGITVKLEGIDELKRRLDAASKTIRTKAVRGALRKAGQVISKAAKVAAPVLRVPTRTRKPGTVRDAISVRNSKFARQAGDEGVFVGVRPAKGARYRTKRISAFGLKLRVRQQTRASQRGADSKNDPYYWKFLEFGTKKMAPQIRGITSKKGFLTTSADAQGERAIKTFMDSVIPQIEKLNRGK